MNQSFEKAERIRACKNRRHVTLVTAYDYPTGRLLDEAGVDIVLVGDSLGMVVLGFPDTTHVTLDHMLHHVEATARGVKNALLVGDMPIHSYDTVEQAVQSAKKLFLAGADAVKLEGGAAQAGEESCEAVLREVKEETGLDVRNAEGGYLFTYKRENPGEGDNYFVDVYRFVMDIDESDLHLQTEETDGYMFATVDEIKAFAAEGKFLHYDSIKKAFEM